MIDRESFFQKYRLEEIAKACPLSWENLSLIYQDYSLNKRPVIEKKAKELVKFFNENEFRGKHSIRYRVKNAEHLIEKIIRNSTTQNAYKYRNISIHNYDKIITDLMGIRILVLEKGQWEGIHEFILDNFTKDVANYINFRNKDLNYRDNMEAKWIVEEPVAYIRYGDKDIFKRKIMAKYTHKDYRSIHYIIKWSNLYGELQVRTLAEEIYGEFDHEVRYPYKRDNKFLKQYTGTLSKVMVATDEMLSLCLRIPDQILDECDRYFEDESYPTWIEEKKEYEKQTKLEDKIVLQGGNILAFGNRKLSKKVMEDSDE